MDDALSFGAGFDRTAWTLPREADELRQPDLGWLASVLWPNADVRLSPPRVRPGLRVAEAYAVIPDASRPRLLLPFSSRTLAGPAIRRYDDGMSRPARARRSTGARVAASRVGWGRFPPLVVSFDRDPEPGELLTGLFREVFDRPDAMLAISLGPLRPNRKPIVQVLTLDGDVLGFAKVAWNDLTRALLRNEAAALRRWTREPPRTFRVPALLHEGVWRGEHPVTVAAPAPTSRRAGTRPSRPPALEVTREIARSGGISLAPLASTAWWRSVLDRGASTPDPTGVVLRWMQDLHGRRLMWHGSWHGDWAPQNMSTVRGVLHVWDWERARDGVPLGLDPIHFHFQFATRFGRDARHAAAVAIRRSAPALLALGVPREDEAVLMACYLAELLVRFDEGRRQGAVTRPGVGEGLLRELRRWVARA